MTAAPGDSDKALRAAETCFIAGDHGRAEEVLRAALTTDPRNCLLLTAYARAKLGQSDWAAAAASAYAALSADPDNEYTMRVYARALEMLGRMDEALSMAWRTVTVHPSSHQAHYAYARILLAIGRPREALAAVDSALRLNPSDIDSLVLRGDILAASGQRDAAEVQYREALRRHPEHADAVHSLAMLEHRRGRQRSALRGLLAAGRLDPSYRDVVRQNVGVILSGVLRRSAWVVLITGLAVVYAYTIGPHGHATIVLRAVAGIGAVVLVLMFARVMRGLSGEMVRSVVAQRQMLALRIVQLVAAVVLGALTAAFGAMTVPAVVASVLVLSLPVVVIAGGLRDERLW